MIAHFPCSSTTSIILLCFRWEQMLHRMMVTPSGLICYLVKLVFLELGTTSKQVNNILCLIFVTYLKWLKQEVGLIFSDKRKRGITLRRTLLMHLNGNFLYRKYQFLFQERILERGLRSEDLDTLLMETTENQENQHSRDITKSTSPLFSTKMEQITVIKVNLEKGEQGIISQVLASLGNLSK